MEENSNCPSELRAAIDKCEGMKKMSQAHKAAASTRKNLEKMLNEAKHKVKEAKEFLQHTVAGKLQV